MNKLLLSFLLSGCFAVTYGQASGSNLNISEEQAINIARSKCFFKTGKEWSEPGADLDVKFNHWLVISQKSTHSDRGSCKRTNGCTIIETREVVIDAETGKIVDKKRTKDKYPNYE
jgi:hypothetical protein